MEVAAGLTTIGVERGDFVALMMDNRVEHVIADQATLHAGGGRRPCNSRSSLAAIGRPRLPPCLRRWA